MAARTVVRLIRPSHRGGPRSRWVPWRSILSLRSVGFAALALAVFSPAAMATPAVTFKAGAIPIRGFPGTGDILGAGTAVDVRVTIAGTEYGGFPSPVTEIDLYAPTGFKVTPAGFPVCPLAALEALGAAGCPTRSSAGPPGVGVGVVAFGGELVQETVSIQQFFAPGGLNVYVEGKTPTSLQVLEKSHWVPAVAPFGPELIVEVPLVETVPGADDASITSFEVKVGAAYRRHGKTVSYFTQPKTCPKSGFTAKMVLKFLSGETVPVLDKVPCPRR